MKLLEQVLLALCELVVLAAFAAALGVWAGVITGAI